MTVYLFANGDLPQVGWIRPLLKQATAVIAANGGAAHLYRLGHPPDIIIGDLDSLPSNVQDWVDTAVTRIISFPAAKDETDLELALLYAVANYPDDIAVIGAFGGRLDQTLANILLLVHPDLSARRVELITPYERAWLVTEATKIRGQPGDTVSLIPLGGDVFILETTGLQWTLRNEKLTFGPARGVSNVMLSEEAAVSIESGVLLCIHTQQGWQR